MRYRERFPIQIPRLGFYPTGALNALTDVPGVRVGHATVQDSSRGLHTGVTAIWPRDDIFETRAFAGGHVIHGAGEMTGLAQLQEWGLLETPILLTSSLNVGRVHDALVGYLIEKHPEIGLAEDVLLPVVAECDDSYLSNAQLRAVGPIEVRAALETASHGPVREGGVGAGTGMICFDHKGGIGTSSRVVLAGPEGAKSSFTVGALLNANFGFGRQLRLAGEPAGLKLPEPAERFKESSDAEGRAARGERSCIVVIATDAPLRPDQLRRLAARAGLGLARTGSFAGHASGEIAIAFSTTAGEPRSKPARALAEGQWLHDAWLNPFYEALVECVEECVLNALSAGKSLEGRDGHRIQGLFSP